MVLLKVKSYSLAMINDELLITKWVAPRCQHCIISERYFVSKKQRLNIQQLNIPPPRVDRILNAAVFNLKSADFKTFPVLLLLCVIVDDCDICNICYSRKGQFLTKASKIIKIYFCNFDLEYIDCVHVRNDDKVIRIYKWFYNNGHAVEKLLSNSFLVIFLCQQFYFL